MSRTSVPLATTRDKRGVVHFGPNAPLEVHAARFEKRQLQLLKGQITLSPLADVAARLVLFNGLGTESSAIAALTAIPDIYRCQGVACLDFVVDRKQDRRLLSLISPDALHQLPRTVTASQATEALRLAAETIYRGEKKPIETLFRDARAWMFKNLPTVLFSHVSGNEILTALPRSALARLETQLAISPLEHSQEDSIADEATAVALENYFEGEGQTGGSWFITEVVTICTVSRKGADATQRNEMLQAVLKCLHQQGRRDRTSWLISAWVVDLIQSGQRSGVPYSPKSIGAYVRAAAPALHDQFSGTDLSKLKKEDFESKYESLIETASDRGHMSAALASWHRFVMRWLELPALPNALFLDTDESVPSANTIWPHEFRRIDSWLEASSGDRQLIGGTRVAIQIGRVTRIRIGELLSLRLRDISEKDGELVVDISARGVLKSAAANRPLIVRDAACIKLLKDWIAVRRKQHALSSDLLFGHPHGGKGVYRCGQFCVLLNGLLKAATGDRNVSFHTTSHARISEDIESALGTERQEDVNLLHALAVPSAHADASTTLRHYSHIFELKLRSFLDAAIRRLPVSSAEAERITGISAATLRKRKAKKDDGRLGVYWDAIMATQLYSPLAASWAGLSMSPAVPPTSIAKERPGLLRDTLDALKCVANGDPLATVAARSGRGYRWLETIVLEAVALLRDLGIHDKQRIPRRPTVQDAAAILKRLFGTAMVGIDFRAALQEKCDSTIRYLDGRLHEGTTKSALDAWQQCYAGRYLCLDSRNYADRLIGLFQQAGVPLERMSIGISKSFGAGPRDAREHLLKLSQRFLPTYRLSPAVEQVEPRRDRPDSYLVISSGRSADGRYPPAASSMCGFHAVFFAASVAIAARQSNYTE